jgi:predicted metal-binding protein
MQGLQHEAVATEGDHAIRPGRIGIAMQAAKPLRRLAGFRRVRGQEGDRIEFHAVFIALTGPDIAYMEGQPLGNSLRAAPPMRDILICSTCKYSAADKTGPDGRTGGETLTGHMRDAIAAKGLPLQVTSQACLWNCKRHCSVVLRDGARFSYFTGDHEPTRAQADAILEWFQMHGETEAGEVPFRQWPDRMRGHFIARIPAVKP